MVAILIFSLSVLALVRFAFCQWRMIWLTTANQPLTDSLRTATGIDAGSIGAHDFTALLGLSKQLSPALSRTTPWLREITWYYRAVEKLEKATRSLLPALSVCAAAEMKTCSRFVAVVLDQHLSVALDRAAAAASS